MDIFGSLKKAVATLLGEGSEKPGSTLRRELTVAVMLIEVARADYERDPREFTALRDALRQSFGLEDDRLEQVMKLAAHEAREATSTYPFTRTVNEEFSDSEKSDLIAAMWRVARADGRIDHYEEHLIRKIAELIYVPHGEFIRRKLEVVASSA